MANIKSSKKDVKRSRANAARNRARTSELKSLTKRVQVLVDGKKLEEAQGLFRTIQSKIARAAGKGVLKKNTASRKVALLAKRIGAIAATK